MKKACNEEWLCYYLLKSAPESSMMLMVAVLPVIVGFLEVRCLMVSSCPSGCLSFNSGDKFSMNFSEILLRFLSSISPSSLSTSWSFSRRCFLVRRKVSGEAEQAFEVVKTGKFLALSRMWSNIVCSEMVLYLLAWISDESSPSAFQGSNCQWKSKEIMTNNALNLKSASYTFSKFFIYEFETGPGI